MGLGEARGPGLGGRDAGRERGRGGVGGAGGAPGWGLRGAQEGRRPKFPSRPSPPLLSPAHEAFHSPLAPRQPGGPTKPLCAGRAGGRTGGRALGGLTPTRAAAGRGPAGTRAASERGVGVPTLPEGGRAGVNGAGRGCGRARPVRGAPRGERGAREPAPGGEGEAGPSEPASPLSFGTGRWVFPPARGAEVFGGTEAGTAEAARRATVQPPVVEPLPPVVMGARRRRRR